MHQDKDKNTHTSHRSHPAPHTYAIGPYPYLLSPQYSPHTHSQLHTSPYNAHRNGLQAGAEHTYHTHQVHQRSASVAYIHPLSQASPPRSTHGTVPALPPRRNQLLDAVLNTVSYNRALSREHIGHYSSLRATQEHQVSGYTRPHSEEARSEQQYATSYRCHHSNHPHRSHRSYSGRYSRSHSPVQHHHRKKDHNEHHRHTTGADPNRTQQRSKHKHDSDTLFADNISHTRNESEATYTYVYKSDTHESRSEARKRLVPTPTTAVFEINILKDTSAIESEGAQSANSIANGTNTSTSTARKRTECTVSEIQSDSLIKKDKVSNPGKDRKPAPDPHKDTEPEIDKNTVPPSSRTTISKPLENTVRTSEEATEDTAYESVAGTSPTTTAYTAYTSKATTPRRDILGRSLYNMSRVEHSRNSSSHSSARRSQQPTQSSRGSERSGTRSSQSTAISNNIEYADKSTNQANSARNHFSAAVTKNFRGHKDKIRHVAWSYDGIQLASASSDHTIKIWHPLLAQSSEINTLTGHSGSVEHMSFNPKSHSQLFTCSQDKTVRLWDTKTATCTNNTTTKGDNIFSAWSPDGKYIAFVNSNDVLTVVDVRKMDTPVKTQSFNDEVNQLSWNSTGEFIVLAMGSGMIQPIPWPSMDRVPPIKAHGGGCVSVAFDPKGKYMAVGSVDTQTSLWDLSEMASVRTFNALVTPVVSLSFTFCGTYLASAAESDQVDIAHVETGESVHQIAIDGQCTAVAWHPTKHFLAYTSYPNKPKDDDRRANPAPEVSVFGYKDTSRKSKD